MIEPSHSHALEYGLMGVSVAVALSGIFLARAFYLGNMREAPARLAGRMTGVYALVLDKYRIDELYAAVIVRPFTKASSLLHRFFDVIVIDLLGVNGTGWTVMAFGKALRFMQTGQVQQYLAGILIGLAVVSVLVFG